MATKRKAKKKTPPLAEGWTVEKPFPEATLRPSLGLFMGQNPYHWHGYLTNGVFEEI